MERKKTDGIGSRIRELRKACHLKQSEFGELIGVSGCYVSGLESGRENPTRKVRMLICEKMNVNMEWLETGNGNKDRIYLKIEILSEGGFRFEWNANKTAIELMSAAGIELALEKMVKTTGCSYIDAAEKICEIIGKALADIIGTKK